MVSKAISTATDMATLTRFEGSDDSQVTAFTKSFGKATLQKVSPDANENYLEYSEEGFNTHMLSLVLLMFPLARDMDKAVTSIQNAEVQQRIKAALQAIMKEHMRKAANEKGILTTRTGNQIRATQVQQARATIAEDKVKQLKREIEEMSANIANLTATIESTEAALTAAVNRATEAAARVAQLENSGSSEDEREEADQEEANAQADVARAATALKSLVRRSNRIKAQLAKKEQEATL